jgi:ABC-2 type transport system permease protein
LTHSSRFWPVKTARVTALLSKELTDIRHHPSIFMPAALTGLIALVMPFVIALVIPAATGEPLARVTDLTAPVHTGMLDAEGVEQAWIFQQFLILLTLSPTAAAMSVAAWSIVGEKQARTLEPLLATPLTTFEILAAKTLSALLPAVVLSTLMFVLYVVAIAVFARDGVAATLLTPVPMGVAFVLAPLSALAALQLTICMSSRTNDPRSAQQVGAFILLPLSALLILQLMGAVRLGASIVLMLAIALLAVNALLARLTILLFDREAILTRWK